MEVIAPVGIPRVRTSAAAPRLDKVQGKRIALLDNSKVNCTPLLDQVQMRLAEDLRVDPCQDLLEPLGRLLGTDAVVLKKQPLARPVGENSRRYGSGRRSGFSQEE